jgi:hypothetical protein
VRSIRSFYVRRPVECGDRKDYRRVAPAILVEPAFLCPRDRELIGGETGKDLEGV